MPEQISVASFSFDETGKILYDGQTVGHIAKGKSLLSPIALALPDVSFDDEAKETVQQRLDKWLNDLVQERLGLLLTATASPLEGIARGLIQKLTESLGAFPRTEAGGNLKALEREDRQALRRLGIHIGRHLIYMPVLLRPASVQLSVLLWALYEDVEPLAPPPAGRVSLKQETDQPEGWLRAASFRPAGSLFVRADILERMAELAWTRLEKEKGPFLANEDFLALAGCGVDQLPGILESLHFNPSKEEGKWLPKSRAKPKPAKAVKKTTKPKNKPAHKPSKPKEVPIDPDNPFAKLQALKFNK